MSNTDIVASDEFALSLQDHSVDDLRRMLAEGMQETADSIRRVAMIVRELEDRGEDLTDLKLSMLTHLRRVAYGQLAAEAVVRFGGYPLLLQKISQYPLPDQRRLASGHAIELAVVTDGKIDYRKADPLHLSGEQVRLVFANDHIRRPEEQAAILSDPAKTPVKRRVRQVKRIKIERERGGLIVGRAFVSHADVLSALAELAGDPIDNEESDDSTPLPVPLTEAEKHHLKVRAAQSGSTMTTLVRRALAAHGLLTKQYDE